MRFTRVVVLGSNRVVVFKIVSKSPTSVLQLTNKPPCDCKVFASKIRSCNLPKLFSLLIKYNFIKYPFVGCDSLPLNMSFDSKNTIPNGRRTTVSWHLSLNASFLNILPTIRVSKEASKGERLVMRYWEVLTGLLDSYLIIKVSQSGVESDFNKI
eukprot:NODE_225_length_13912_cov_0.499674.p5 type:complete len:155 gc:universal NODE_225_length_13912_cov_0.499674:6642-6178(-)